MVQSNGTQPMKSAIKNKERTNWEIKTEKYNHSVKRGKMAEYKRRTEKEKDLKTSMFFFFLEDESKCFFFLEPFRLSQSVCFKATHHFLHISQDSKNSGFTV